MSKSTVHRAAAHCLGALIFLSAVHAARADVVTDWNETAVRATEIAGAPVPVQMRMMAIVHAAIFDAVKRLGSKNSTERTSEQTAIAIHWAGSEVPPLNAVARAVSAAKKLNLIDNARFFALLSMVMADSLIAGFEVKYGLNYWRPVTAIRNAGLANNPAISADPAWESLIVTPPHPDYPSGHALGAGAAVAVLQAIFGSDTFSATYVYPPLGVLRRWESFSQIAKEVEDARVWGGIHFRTADEHGTQLGRQVAEFALKTRLLPKTKTD